MNITEISNYTNQEIFNYVANNLLKQNRQSKSGYKCMYKNGDDHCAVGFLLTDNQIAQVGNTSGLSNVFTTLGLDRETDQYSLLFELQKVHDHLTPDRWNEALTILALSKGLNTDILN